MTHPRATNDKYAGIHDTDIGLVNIRYVGRAEATICRHAQRDPRRAGWYWQPIDGKPKGPFPSSRSAFWSLNKNLTLAKIVP